ncbi:hypothetical protein TSPI_09732 [Trichinella spiralis]|uniref:Uncharacterized protein n=1 Tax=Trichinella spiralis TaxID=6334 RepID=A0ABR3KRS0_TRISP
MPNLSRFCPCIFQGSTKFDRSKDLGFISWRHWQIRSSSNLFTLDRLAPGSLELETRFKFPILRRRCRRLFSEMRDLQKSIFDASRPIWSMFTTLSLVSADATD